MKYFAIENSLNEKILGKIPQVKEYIFHCDVEDEPTFIDKFIFEKIEINPILSNVNLYSNAKQTDFIDTYGYVGFGFGYLISNKFKDILNPFNVYGIQYFETYIIQKNQKFDNYWQTNIYDFPYQYIDFKKTTFFIKDSMKRKIISGSLEIHNLDDFYKKIDSLKFPESISISNVSFDTNMNLDFFSLRFFENGGYKGIVSERLKNEIEKNEITGIEFRPIEIPYQDWSIRDGPRDKIYGRSW